jgi:hypothetical protein
VFNGIELSGQLLLSGVSNSTGRRLDQGLEPRGIDQADAPLRELLGQPAGEDDVGFGARPGGLAEAATEFIGADQPAGGHLAAQLYAATLAAIAMDTDAERQYLRRLARGLGLEASVVRRVRQCLDVGHA